ncbi:MAG TPA: RDD family protein [Micromonosporaceae bacterium]
MSENPPGWYRDPAEPATQRYWDGDGWVGDRLPVDATPPEGPLHTAPVIEPDEPPTSLPPGVMPPGPYPQHPGMLPPGAYPPGVLPPGAYPPGMLPPGAYPPGMPPPGAYPPGVLPPGAYPPGMLPPGAYPPGANLTPPQSMPPGSTHPMPPGMMPPGIPYAYGPYVLAPLPAPQPHGFDLAPLGRRFWARMIDIGLVLLINVVLNGYLIYQFVRQVGPYLRAVNAATNSGGANPSSGDLQSLFYAIIFLALVIWAVYEVPSTGSTGQTVGKRLMHLRVLPLEGDHQLGGRRAFRRFLPMGLPMLAWACGLGFVIQVADSLFTTFNKPLKLALHDMYAATVVVSVPRAIDVAEVEKSANGGHA